MTATVQTCPTCHGTGGNRVFDGTDYALHGRCPDCPIVPGYRVPDPWFVVVPTRWWTDSAPGDGASSLITDRPDPRWQPGATIALSTDSGDPTEPPEKVGSAVITDLVPMLSFEHDEPPSPSESYAVIYPDGMKSLWDGPACKWIHDIDVACSPGDHLARLKTP